MRSWDHELNSLNTQSLERSQTELERKPQSVCTSWQRSKLSVFLNCFQRGRYSPKTENQQIFGQKFPDSGMSVLPTLCIHARDKIVSTPSSPHLGIGPYRNREKAPQLLEESVPGRAGAPSVTQERGSSPKPPDGNTRLLQRGSGADRREDGATV